MKLSRMFYIMALYGAAIWRPCYCGDGDDNDDKPEAQPSTSSMGDGHAPSGGAPTTDQPAGHNAEDTPSDVPATTTPSSTTLEEPLGPSIPPVERVTRPKEISGAPQVATPTGVAINFAVPMSSSYKSFEYVYNENRIVLIVPNPGVSVTRVDHFNSLVWQAQEGETLEYAKGYISCKKVGLILVTKRGPYGVSGKWFTRTRNAWVECMASQEAIRRHKTPDVPIIAEILIDVNNPNDIPECTVFEARILGLPARFYFPKPGYLATEVLQGYKSIWRSNGYDICVSCDLYSRRRRPFLVLLSIREGRSVSYKYFYKDHGQWREVGPQEFDKRRKEMVAAGASPGESSSSKPKERKGFVGAVTEFFTPKKKVPKRDGASDGPSGPQGISNFGFEDDGSTEGRMNGGRMDDDQNVKHHAHSIETHYDLTILDISTPNPTLYRTFGYHYDNVPVKLIVPNPVGSVKTIMDGSAIIWAPPHDRILRHAKLYLDGNGKPELIYIVSRICSGTLRQYYAKVGGRWRPFRGNYNDKLRALKVHVEEATEFTLDLSATTSTDHCVIFDVPLYGVDTRFYIPRIGHDAKEVTDDHAIIWEAGENGKCLSCDVYNGTQPLLLLVANYGGATNTLHFEKVNGEWIGISVEEFDAKKSAHYG